MKEENTPARPNANPDRGPADSPADEAPEMVTGQDRTKRLLRAGVFAIIGMVLLLVGVFVIGEKQNMFTTTFMVHTRFKDVAGLKSGAAVMLNGIKIGSVSTVELRREDTSFVYVDMVLDGSYREFIRTSTSATIGQQGLIGDKMVELQIGLLDSPPVEDGDYVRAIPPTNYLAILDDARAAVLNTESITASLDTFFIRLRQGEGTLGKLLTDEEAYNGLVNLSVSARSLFDQTGQQFASMSGTLNRAAGNVADITDESRKLIADIGAGKGSIGALLYDRSLYDSLESLTSTLNEAAGSAGFAAREFGLNMRGLRNNWLVGGLFGGGKDEEEIELQTKMLTIRQEELRRQQQLLEQREREILDRERKVRE